MKDDIPIFAGVFYACFVNDEPIFLVFNRQRQRSVGAPLPPDRWCRVTPDSAFQFDAITFVILFH